MYAPKQFKEDRPEVLAATIRDIQLATLVTATADGYHASHVPMVLKQDEGGTVLETHVARPNPHWDAFRSGPVPSLAIFQGPQAYVSPSWYETKRQHGRVVPTWNYIAVHAHGPVSVVEDQAWLLSHLAELTDANEGGRDQPWAVSDAPAEFVVTLTRAIVGLRLQVARLEGAWKLIQHRPEGDRLGAAAGLSASPRAGDRAVGRIMQELEAARRSGAS